MREIDASGDAVLAPNRYGIGRITMWPSLTPPVGFLVCDGSEIPPENELLRAVVGTHTPDLRSKFLRSWSAAHQPGTALASSTAQPVAGKPGVPSASFTHSNHSIAAAGNHNHGGNYGIKGAGAGSEGLRGGPNDSVGGNTISNAKLRQEGDHFHTLLADGGHVHQIDGYDPTTVPDNVRLVYIIKATPW